MAESEDFERAGKQILLGLHRAGQTVAGGAGRVVDLMTGGALNVGPAIDEFTGAVGLAYAELDALPPDSPEARAIEAREQRDAATEQREQEPVLDLDWLAAQQANRFRTTGPLPYETPPPPRQAPRGVQSADLPQRPPAPPPPPPPPASSRADSQAGLLNADLNQMLSALTRLGGLNK